MMPLLVRFGPEPPAECAVCQGVCTASDGPRLVQEDGRPVCLRCGKTHAPALIALLRLADEAARVGKIARHNVPPYTALLELARAADAYASLMPG